MCFQASAPGTLAKKNYDKVENAIGINLTDPVPHYVQMEGLRDLNRIEKDIVGDGQESDILNWTRRKTKPGEPASVPPPDFTQQAAEASAEEKKKQRKRKSRRTTILTSGVDTETGYGLGSGSGKKT